jgi:vacuolar-type H+-ATPase subunit B/Vma2
MSGLEQYLQRARSSGLDRKPHWEVGLNDGTSERGEIVDVLSDSVILRELKKRSSANTRHEAVHVMQDVVHSLIPFASIRLIRMLEGSSDTAA